MVETTTKHNRGTISKNNPTNNKNNLKKTATVQIALLPFFYCKKNMKIILCCLLGLVLIGCANPSKTTDHNCDLAILKTCIATQYKLDTQFVRAVYDEQFHACLVQGAYTRLGGGYYNGIYNDENNTIKWYHVFPKAVSCEFPSWSKTPFGNDAMMHFFYPPEVKYAHSFNINTYLNSSPIKIKKNADFRYFIHTFYLDSEAFFNENLQPYKTINTAEELLEFYKNTHFCLSPNKENTNEAKVIFHKLYKDFLAAKIPNASVFVFAIANETSLRVYTLRAIKELQTDNNDAKSKNAVYYFEDYEMSICG